MDFKSFLQSTISAVSQAAEAASSLCGAVQPVLALLGNNDREEPICIGLVQFDSVDDLMKASMELKRLETLLSIVSQVPSEDISKPDDKDKGPEQLVWIHLVTNILSEITYLQQVLLKTEAPPSTQDERFDYTETTNVFHALLYVAASYGNDLKQTVGLMSVLTGYQSASFEALLSAESLGRIGDTWAVTDITYKDDYIQPQLDSWSGYLVQVGNGDLLKATRDLKW